MEHICSIIFSHIQAAEKYIIEPTQGALLFHEKNFLGREWKVTTTSGFSSTMPLFIYMLEEIEFKVDPCTIGSLLLFMRKTFDKMQLATECIIISLIYIEKLMIMSKIEIRYCNWKPIFFTAILLASKFWEDINFWNVDYADGLNYYPLKAINRLECEFVAMCEYHLFVSAELYTKYYITIKEVLSPDNQQQNHFLSTLTRF